jgi:hypothetical protein
MDTRSRCNKCNKLFPLNGKGFPDYYSLKGTGLSPGKLGIAFRYCTRCFIDLKLLIADYIQ